MASIVMKDFSETQPPLLWRNTPDHLILKRIKAPQQTKINVQQYVSARYTDLKNSIEEVMRECAEDDWDGEGSVAVNRDSAEFALEYFSTFIEGVLPHNISCDPFGCIMAEWYGNAALAAIAFQTDKVYHVFGYNKKIRHFSKKTDDSRMAHKFIAELGF